MVDCCVICGDIIPEGSHVCPACAKTLGYDIIHKEPQRRNSIMKVNWKVRFQNKVWLSSFFACILTFVYTMLGMFDIYPEITKNDVGEIINSVLMFMSLVGIIVDPTTAGLNDSNRAMGYLEPWIDGIDDLDDTTTEIHNTEPEEETEDVGSNESESEG